MSVSSKEGAMITRGGACSWATVVSVAGIAFFFVRAEGAGGFITLVGDQVKYRQSALPNG